MIVLQVHIDLHNLSFARERKEELEPHSMPCSCDEQLHILPFLKGFKKTQQPKTLHKTLAAQTVKREEELLTLQGRPADGQCPPGRPWPHPPRVLQDHREQLSDKARGWPSYAHTALHTSPAAFGREQSVPLPATADLQHPTHPHTHTHTHSLSLSLHYL